MVPPPPPSAPPSPAAEVAEDDDESVFDLRVLIPVLIGVITLAIAVLTWRAAQLSENATDNDRQSVSDTVLVSQNEASVNTQLRDDQTSFLQYRQAIEDAGLLEAQATNLRTAGLTGAAQVYEDEAGSQRETATNRATLTFGLQYVKVGDDGTITFDADQRRSDLLAANRQLAQVNPDASAAKAESLRRSSQWKVGWIVALVGVIVLLTIAQISRNKTLRPVLMGVSLVLFVSFLAAGFAR